jgi:signal peptidase II
VGDGSLTSARKTFQPRFSAQEKYLLFTLTVVPLVLMDQIVKIHILKFSLGKLYTLFPGFNIIHVHNTGASFGILQGQQTFLIGFSLLVIAGVLWYLPQIPFHRTAYLAMILGGTIGNLIDRVSYGFVVDYLSIPFWPAFNIADMAISFGALILIYHLWKEDNKNDTSKSKKSTKK